MRSSALIAAVLLAFGLTACNADDSQGGSGADSGDQAKLAPATPTVELPPGITLTPPGTVLQFGQPATVFWAPDTDLHAALGVAVTAARHVTAEELKGFNLDVSDYTKNAAFYFVNVTLTNLGDGDVGGRDVPLSGVAADRVLLPPVVFESPFEPCPSTPLPKEFATGATYDGCLVFAAPDHGDLEAVTFQPVESIEPIDWPGASAGVVTQ